MNEVIMRMLNNIPGIVVLCLGYALVVLEMFLPGFGLPGISGAILLIAGVYLLSTTALEAIALAGFLAVLILIALFFAIRSASKGRFAKSKFVLNDVAVNAPQTQPKESALEDLLGAIGTADTALRPSGMAIINSKLINVVTDGHFIEKGEAVKVIDVKGNKITVKKAN